MSHESSQWLSLGFDAPVSICLRAASLSNPTRFSGGSITAASPQTLSRFFFFCDHPKALRLTFSDLSPQTEVSSILYLGLLTDVVAWQPAAADGSVGGGQTVNTEVAWLFQNITLA